MLSSKPINASVLFFDMNSFFARVEQQVRPILRGKPVGVAPYTGNSGCVIAASYEAKSLGVTCGFRVGEAKRQCPSLIILPARPALYHLYHKEIIKAAETLTPFLRVLSIDEFSIKLTGRDRNSQAAKDMAYRLKDAITQKVGDWLTCSVGIGPNQFLAKTAAEMKKPDGLFEIHLEDLNSIYQSLKLTDICGISRGISKQCRALGLYTPYSIYQLSLPEMTRYFKLWGKVWYYRLRGYEMDDIVYTTKSIGHSHVLSPEYRCPEGVRQILVKLSEKTAYRLRKGGFWATRLFLGLNFTDGNFCYKAKRIYPMQDSQTLIKSSLSALNELVFTSTPLTLFLSTSGFIKNHSEPISLFSLDQKYKSLSRALDQLNDKFGASTVYSASMFGTEDAAPDRIPFGTPRFDIRY